MCRNAYEEYVERSGKVMILCKLRITNTSSDMEKLCVCQRFCSDKDKYIPHQQKEGCKYYED